jgi:uncharacterized integral membrane protein
MKEIMVFIALVVCALLMFLAILGTYFPMRKELKSVFEQFYMFPNVRWKQSRDYIILMNMMSFVLGMLICSIIVFIYEGGF